MCVNKKCMKSSSIEKKITMFVPPGIGSSLRHNTLVSLEGCEYISATGKEKISSLMMELKDELSKHDCDFHGVIKPKSRIKIHNTEI